jgi:hypothetical protein
LRGGVRRVNYSAMARPNPGPFEPIVYVIQTPAFFRVVGLGGFVLFTIASVRRAASDGAAGVILGLILLAALWAEASVNVCRRCRFYDTWHCLGQAKLVARFFAPVSSGLDAGRVTLHFAVVGLYLAWMFFWMWHSVFAGILVTIWIPLFLLSATPPGGFSWRATGRPSKAA